MKNGNVSIALIGAGRAGMIHARNFRSSVPNATLCAFADPVEEAAINAAREAAKHVQNGDTIAIDTGTTAQAFASPRS